MATFAGFGMDNIAAYFGVSQDAANGIIALGNGATIGALPAHQQVALRALPPSRFRPGASTYNQGFGDIPWGLDHLAQHPLGSHYHGDFNVVDLVSNVATGGLYGVAKAGFNVATGGKVLPNVADAFAVTGPAGSALQPTIGTKKTLIAEAAIATVAIGAAPAGSFADIPLVGSAGAALGPFAGAVGGYLLNAGKSLFSTIVNDIGAPPTDQRGASPGSPIMPTSGNPTYFVTGASSPGATLITGNGTPGGTPAPASPTPLGVSPAVLAVSALGILGVVLLIRRRRP